MPESKHALLPASSSHCWFNNNPSGEVTHDMTQNKLVRDALIKEAKRISQIRAKLPARFTDTLNMHIDRLKLSNEQIAENCGISTRTLSNWRNDEERNKPLKQMVALCLGLHLEPDLSIDLIEKSGNKLSITNEHVLFSLLLRTMYKCSLYDCDAILREANCKPFQREQ